MNTVAAHLRAAIYLVNSLVKKSDFGLIATALKCVATGFNLIVVKFQNCAKCIFGIVAVMSQTLNTKAGV